MMAVGSRRIFDFPLLKPRRAGACDRWMRLEAPARTLGEEPCADIRCRCCQSLCLDPALDVANAKKLGPGE
jgi:hypothetical protein